MGCLHIVWSYIKASNQTRSESRGDALGWLMEGLWISRRAGVHPCASACLPGAGNPLIMVCLLLRGGGKGQELEEGEAFLLK